jgi:N-acetylglucosaminyldiphosphoundecaprenol N-acetyl-beta-D-mannosaminyltransferase
MKDQVQSCAQFQLLGVPIAATSTPAVIHTIRSWIARGDRGRMVTFSSVNMIVEAARDPEFLDLLRRSDMNCPDGMPLVWYGRRRTTQKVDRVCGPDFLPAFCAATESTGIRHFFYGGTEGVAARAAEELMRNYPGTEIVGVYSPPFRQLTLVEEDEVIRSINAAKPDVLWVCLGCPKQEVWIDRFRKQLNVGVFLAVGLAIDIVGGKKSRAPRLLRSAGLEWLFRLFQEPRRLWKRYLIYNTIFLLRLLKEMLAI